MTDFGATMFVNAFAIIFRLAINALFAVLVGKAAKNAGLSFKLYFIITFLFGVIGLIICLIMINQAKMRNNFMQNRYQQNNFQNPYPQEPYQNPAQPYQQPPAYQQDPNTAQSVNQTSPQPDTPQRYGGYSEGSYYDTSDAPTSPLGRSFTCNECGNVQSSGGFCKVCGSKL